MSFEFHPHLGLIAALRRAFFPTAASVSDLSRCRSLEPGGPFGSFGLSLSDEDPRRDRRDAPDPELLPQHCAVCWERSLRRGIKKVLHLTYIVLLCTGEEQRALGLPKGKNNGHSSQTRDYYNVNKRMGEDKTHLGLQLLIRRRTRGINSL